MNILVWKVKSWIKEKQVWGLNNSLDFNMGFSVEDNTIKALFLLKTERTKYILQSVFHYSNNQNFQWMQNS